LLLFSVVASVASASGLHRFSGNPLLLPLVLAAVMAIFSGSTYWHLQRVDGDLSVLSGQYLSTDAYFVDWGGSPRVANRIRNGRPIVVQTSAVTQTSALTRTSGVVQTSALVQTSASVHTSTLGKASVEAFARSLDYEVVAANQRLTVLKPAGTGKPAGPG